MGAVPDAAGPQCGVRRWATFTASPASITTAYGFDVFHRRGSFGRAKYRVRRYDESPRVFLERKLRSSVVTKRRTLVNLEELARLRGEQLDRGWAGGWFHGRMLARDEPLVPDFVTPVRHWCHRRKQA